MVEIVNEWQRFPKFEAKYHEAPKRMKRILYPKTENYLHIKFSGELWKKYASTVGPTRAQWALRNVKDPKLGYTWERGPTKSSEIIDMFWPDLSEKTEYFRNREIFLLRGLVDRLPEINEKVRFVEGLPFGKPSGLPHLRPYQDEVYRAVFDQLQKTGTGTIYLASGGGKTEIAVALLKYLLEEDIIDKAFYLSLNTTLVNQTKERFMEYGVRDVGAVTGKIHETGFPITCITVQTLISSLYDKEEASVPEDTQMEIERRLENNYNPAREWDVINRDYRDADIVVIDECQHVPANTVKLCVLANEDAMRVSMSATPWRNDSRDMEIYAFTGNRVHPYVSSSYLIKRDWLVPPAIQMVQFYNDEYEKTYDLRASAKGSSVAGLKAWVESIKLVIYNEKRMKVLTQLCEKLKQKEEEILELYGIERPLTPVLMLVREREQGYELKTRLKLTDTFTGDDVVMMTGDTPRKKRKEIMDAANRREIDVVTATTVADEGIDIQNLRTLILTGGGKSSVRTVQRIGRVVRTAPDWAAPKKAAVVFDVWDQSAFSEEHGAERKNHYNDEEEWRIDVDQSIDKALKEIEKYLM